eukprot:GHRR01008238.1.p1 GENE.GHRR01008238.1~~GHRR01008238.1.p1  ORF type:complete len:213 (+),score=64.38 GHRR01008238.1:132-770(+)
MAQTMRALTSTSDVRGARTMAAQRPSIALFGGRVVRLQQRQMAQGAFAPCSRAQQLQRNTNVVCVAAQEAPAQQQNATQWYALVANAEFFCNDVQNESLAEQLRERVRYFKEQNRPTDFYLIPNPTWLDANFPAQAKQVRRPCLALVSTDKQWITFMKLRLDRVMKLDLAGMPESEVLAKGEELPEFKEPAKWTAPYSAYSKDWWKVFYPSV